MKYYAANFNILGPEGLIADARDLLAALLGEAGFETFEETESGLTGYVQQALWDRESVEQATAQLPLPGVTVEFDISEAEDRDWNETWEQEGFEPIVIGDGRLVIHDGRHTYQQAAPHPIAVEIDAHLAFGTGNHETTRMICAELLAIPLAGKRVLDAGCGTGILGIVAMKLGADSCLSYDIDEWSVDNTRHNAVINNVNGLTTALGDSAVLQGVDGRFDLIMANINRNILMADLPRFRQAMAPGARLILSGFYTADAVLLVEQAAQLGLVKAGAQNEGDWACLSFDLPL